MKIVNYPEGKPFIIIKSLGRGATAIDSRDYAEDLIGQELPLHEISHVANGTVCNVSVHTPNDKCLVIFTRAFDGSDDGTELELIWR